MSTQTIDFDRGVRRFSPSILFLALLTAATLFTLPRRSPHDEPLYTRYAHVTASLRQTIVEHTPLMAEQELSLSSKQLLQRWDPLIAEASRRFRVPADWIRAVIRVESGGRTVKDDAPITSPVGAMGLMQVMPGTYAEMREQYRLGSNPYNPRDNIAAGTAYLRWLRARFGYPAMFAAYNDGPGKYLAHLKTGAALPDETRAYSVRVAKILGVPGGSERVRLTRPDGVPLVVEAAQVVSVRAPLRGEYAARVRAVLHIGRKSQGVHETVAVALATLRAHGGLV